MLHNVTINAVKIKLHCRIEDIDPARWNALVVDNYPFLRHEFLAAMERHGCVGEQVGWIPRHLACYDDNDILLGAMPMYEKHNSWGEFVFDHAWADAYHRAGLSYYPKLVNAIPFTPASGQRLLARADNRNAIIEKLLRGAFAVMQQGQFSGMHSLFVDNRDYALLNQPDAMTRIDCQFHWHNNQYQHFDQFLGRLTSKKRKNIRQERRKAIASGVTIKRLDGHSATATDWINFNQLYRQIYNRKYGAPAFNLAFFKDIAASLGSQVILVMVNAGSQCVAGALLYHDDHSLYGRHWGCAGYLDSLHFEVCYYQGIDFCIEHGLNRFDPGAQGEHKIARGFIPTETRSLHWIADKPFQPAIADFVRREQTGVRGYIEAIARHSPYQV